MTNTFKVGDKVEFIENYGNYKKGDTVTVTLIRQRLISANGYKGSTECFDYRLKLVPPEFTYEDIQKGDTIRRTQTYLSGAKDVREGVAVRQGSYYWADAGRGFILAFDEDTDWEGVTLELLNRPTPPEPKKPWEDAKPGTVLRRTTPTVNGTSLLILQENGEWLIRYSNGGTHTPYASIGEYIHESDKIEVVS